MQRKVELEAFLKNQDIQIMLVSETHFVDNTYFKIYGYKVYCTHHPSGRAYGGTTIITKSSIKRYELSSYKQDHIQATSVMIYAGTSRLAYQQFPTLLDTIYKKKNLTTLKV